MCGLKFFSGEKLAIKHKAIPILVRLESISVAIGFCILMYAYRSCRVLPSPGANTSTINGLMRLVIPASYSNGETAIGPDSSFDFIAVLLFFIADLYFNIRGRAS